MIIWSLYTATDEPGYVPPLYRPPNYTDEQLESAKKEAEETPKERRHVLYNYYKKLRWCIKCKRWKAPRSHHCRICKKCVLKMDHHCPWINQCVGLNNHKSFVLFIFYLNIGIFVVVSCLVGRVIDVFKGKNYMTEYEWILLFTTIIYGLYIFLTSILILGNQVFLISKGMTKNELWTKHWATSAAIERGTIYKYPYDKGYFSNLCEVFGSPIWVWFFPTSPRENGLLYPDLVPDNKENA